MVSKKTAQTRRARRSRRRSIARKPLGRMGKRRVRQLGTLWKVFPDFIQVNN